MLEHKWKFPVSPISAELLWCGGVGREQAAPASSCFYLLVLVVRKAQLSASQGVLVPTRGPNQVQAERWWKGPL